ncbi:MAG: 1,4-alpha-glucan branching enzyme [Verrucomicrobia bacterium]|nr:MAG: 1,4-alpha-glucan branching enzyme [Verrucomicrobiota bacterium]
MNFSTLSDADFYALIEARHPEPFRFLGFHPLKSGAVARVFRPDVAEVILLDRKNSSRVFPLPKIHPVGFFEKFLPDLQEPFPYILELADPCGKRWREYDPYSFGPILKEADIYAFREGIHVEIYKKLGAHLLEREGVSGAHFAVWAPHAQRVSIVGDFNQWDGRRHCMRKLNASGLWEIFLPGVYEGKHYKFEVRTADGTTLLKTDPFAAFAQHDTQTACIVYDLTRFVWSDAEWMRNRAKRDIYRTPFSTYEVHLASWKRTENDRPFSYVELVEELIPYVKKMGFTHIELMPIMEHPFDGSWGYQLVNYYAPTSRFGTPDEFRYFIDQCHLQEIGVILDWPPGHFPKDIHGLARYDGTCLYEYEDPRIGEHKNWGTLVFNYGRKEVTNFLMANAIFWLNEYHVDGLRVDAVASMLYLDYSRQPGKWVPNHLGGHENLEAIQFLKNCNEVCCKHHPGILMIAEESTTWPGISQPVHLGGVGFGFKWNMGWMNDSLRYMARDPIHRRFHQQEIIFSLAYAFSEHFILVLSHDEVVHGKGSLLGKMPGDVWQKFANLRMFIAWMWAHPGKKLLFQGGEFGQWNEWSYARSLDWHLLSSPMHQGLQRLVQHLNRLYVSEPSLYECDDCADGFEWIDYKDSDRSIWSFLRKTSRDEPILFIVNATPVIRYGYRVGVHRAGCYREILNTDAEIYGGGNVVNTNRCCTQSIAWQGKEHSICVELPPLSLLAFKAC